MAKKAKKERKGNGILHEFKAFITRGNILDMAVGVIIGGAFSAIINSVVNNVLMPLIALALGRTDLSTLGWVLNGVPMYITDQTTGAQIVNPEAVILGWGTLVQAIINFLIIALVLFIIVKVANSLAAARAKALEKRLAEEKANEPAPEPAPEPEPDPTIVLLGEIRDLLKEEKTHKTAK